jgi:arginyl-tRNA--protein-N-Asp/Glu arginylyltransferase
MWHRVDVVLTDVSEEHIAFIFRVKEKIIRKSACEETDRTVAIRLIIN